MEQFTITLRSARINSGYSVNEVSKMLGVRASTIYKYENNSGAMKISKAKQLSELLGVSYDYIFFG